MTATGSGQGTITSRHARADGSNKQVLLRDADFTRAMQQTEN